MATVTFSHVSKIFNQRRDGLQRAVRAVDDVSLKLEEGELLGVLGPSGCGKSTFLRLIAGLETPDAGEIYFDNQLLQEIDIKDRGIGMVFQTGALMPHWEGWRSVGLFLSLRQRERELPERVREVAKVTGIGIEGLLAKRPKQLSGGEVQRVGIAPCPGARPAGVPFRRTFRQPGREDPRPGTRGAQAPVERIPGDLGLRHP